MAEFSFSVVAFDQALLPPAILALAGGFITGGCDISPLGVKGELLNFHVASSSELPFADPLLLDPSANAALTVTADTKTVQSGSKLSFSSGGPSVTGQLFCSF